MNTITTAIAGCVLACATLSALDVNAATLRVQCEQRGATRSKISVDGKDLAALPAGQTYSAQVMSGANMATAPGAALIGDEVEFDFDSNRGDVAAGATAIASNFITGGTVVGKILAPDGSTVISDTVSCRVRNR
ncbi:MAG: hypothetical protein ACRDAM_13080 [Casimicrobium sp.]